jgi:alkylation response protein AidB-like acyl-CoA dehydrogenase
MQRTIFDADHEAFRASAREYADRTLTPRMDEFLEAKTFPRDIWLEAGKQGFLGLDVPEEYGGSSAGDYLFNAVFHEELAQGVAVGLELSYRVARAWRDARVTKIWAGSNEIMKELIGRDLGL